MTPQQRRGRSAVIVLVTMILGGCNTQPTGGGRATRQAQNSISRQDEPAQQTLPEDETIFVRVETIGNGRVVPGEGEFLPGIVRFTAIPDDGWEFERWETAGTFEEANPFSIDVATGSLVVAVFVEEEEVTTTPPEDADPSAVTPPAAVGASGFPVDRMQNATWLIVWGNEGDPLPNVATGFGISSDTLATNAHVVQSILETFTRQGPVAVAFQHETGNSVVLTEAWIHPQYIGTEVSATPDVGLLRVDGLIPVTLPLADTNSLFSVAVFDDIALCGFPGDVAIVVDLAGLFLASDVRPRATCLEGTVSALRPFDPGAPASSSNTQLIQYDLPTVPGTSGSAAVNAAGEVVGVNSFGFNLLGGDSNFSIRSDVLADLIDWADTGVVDGVDLTAPLQSSSQCDTSYYNDDVRAGIDIPPGSSGPTTLPIPTAPLGRAEQYLLYVQWTTAHPTRNIDFLVLNVSNEAIQDLDEWVDNILIPRIIAGGETIGLVQRSVPLPPNGRRGIGIVSSLPFVGVASVMVTKARDAIYFVSATIPFNVPEDIFDVYVEEATDTTFSLCVDE